MLVVSIMVRHKGKIFIAGAALFGVFAFSKFYLGLLPKPQVLPKNVFTINLKGVGKSAAPGTATIEDVSGDAVIILNFPGLTDSEMVMPAYIHSGSCNNIGKELYKLAVPDAGQSETDLTVGSDQLKSSAPLTIDLRKSTTDSSVVACGEITK